MAKLMLDIDGVLADWWEGFSKTARGMGFEMPVIHHAASRSWSSAKEFLEPGEVSAVWDKINHDPHWWMRLKPMVDHKVILRLNNLTWDGHQLYFVTSRPSRSTISAQRQTHLWLARQGVVTPNVVVSQFKGETAKAIGIDFSLEDKVENAWFIAWYSPDTISYLIDRPYNRLPKEPDIGTDKIIRVRNIGVFLDDIEAELGIEEGSRKAKDGPYRPLPHVCRCGNPHFRGREVRRQELGAGDTMEQGVCSNDAASS